jgi:tRNA (guanine9-N1)-methyltransferase
MGNASYRRWSNTQWWTEGYDRLWLAEGTSTAQATVTSNEEEHENHVASGAQPPINEVNSDPEAIRQTVVYLTADSEEELTELKPDETYIIGGICDHNRYKVATTLASFLLVSY